MAYATRADIETIYGADTLARVADRDFDEVIDDAAVDAALARASAEMDGYIRSRYALPLAEEQPLLVQPCIDIAIYRLAQSGAGRTDEDRTRYEDAVKLMDRISKGKVELVLPPPPGGDATEGLGPQPVVIEGPERLFSREKLRGI
ncbi:MAG: DUF1320 domain-containing protein [Pseudomonadota bacterium]